MWERVGASGVLECLVTGEKIGRCVFGEGWPELFLESERNPIAEQQCERESGVGCDARGENELEDRTSGAGWTQWRASARRILFSYNLKSACCSD